MRYIPPRILIVLSTLLVLGTIGCLAQTTADEADTVTSTFEVEGMTCGGCESGVKLKVKRLEGVTRVDASYKEGTATVTYKPKEVTPEKIVAAIEELGYAAKLREVEES